MCNFSFNGSTAQVVQSFFCELPRSHTVTPHSSGSVIDPSQRPLPDNTQYYQKTSMPPEGFEPAIPASDQLHTLALDRAGTGIGDNMYMLAVRE